MQLSLASSESVLRVENGEDGHRRKHVKILHYFLHFRIHHVSNKIRMSGEWCRLEDAYFH